MKPKKIKLTKKFIDKEIKNNTLFVREEYLPSLPEDWIDCVTFLLFNGTKERKDLRNDFTLFLDDDASEQLIKFTLMDSIKLFVIRDREKGPWWDVLLFRAKKSPGKDDCVCFLGTEGLRLYCDEKNIYYSSFIGKNGFLCSSTTFKYLKDPDEDCRLPMKIEC